jgi:hypothetical protein
VREARCDHVGAMTRDLCLAAQAAAEQPLRFDERESPGLGFCVACVGSEEIGGAHD